MKIKSISIKYFRGLRDISIPECDEHVNLFLGINGAGKSSVLDALAIIFSWYTARMQSATGRGRDIPKDDIAIHSPNGCTIELGMHNNANWKLYRSLKYKKTDRSDLSAMNADVAELRIKLENDPYQALPVIIHYGVNRTVPNAYPHLPRSKKEATQLDANKNSLSGGQKFSDFFNWFRQAEDYENEQYKADSEFKDPGLDAVRRCMASILPEYSDMKVTRRPLALTMRKGNETLKLNQLSDGEKCYISLVCDIARRLAIANPKGDPLQGEGIILIDEIDLHLHPQWQQSVVTSLVNTFPNCQFFITSHSPIVASDVNGKVFGIKEGEIVPQLTYGKLSSNILTSAFEVKSLRSPFVQSLFDSGYEAIDRNDNMGYTKNLSLLNDILGSDDIDIAGLKIEKLRREKFARK